MFFQFHFIAFLIHRSMLPDLPEEANNLQDLNRDTLNFGNKLSVLGGDFLLAKSSVELAKLHNTDVVRMISQAIGDMAEGATIEAMDVDVSQWTLKEWENYVFLLKGSLMAHSCKSATLMGQQDQVI